MSHSCTPNCQAIIMACGGRLTIALYTLRHVHEGGWVRAGAASKRLARAGCSCYRRVTPPVS